MDMNQMKKTVTRPWGYARKKLAPMVEVIERREMLDAGFAAITGTLYQDSNGNGSIDPADARLPGATVQLYHWGASTPLATVTSDARGEYAFDGLAPGTYVLRQVPLAGSAVVANRFVSDLYPASAIDAGSVQITVGDPSKVYLNYKGVVDGQFLVLSNVVNGQAMDDSVGPLAATLGTSAGSNDLNGGFVTYCVDDMHRISFEGGETFRVDPRPITALDNGTTTIPAANAGRVAYLFNHYGNASLTNVQAAGLQLAIWELIYDGNPTPDFTAGNFQSLKAVDPADQALYTQAIAAATEFYQASAGQAESAILLHASTAPVITWNDDSGYQSMLAREQFDFLSSPRAVDSRASLSGYVYLDCNDDGIRQPGEPPIAGVVVTLTGTDEAGKAVSIQTQTDANGLYVFGNLSPGVYTITQTQPKGFLDGRDTQGTPGNGTTVNDAFVNIDLTAGTGGTDNNFGELVAPASCNGLRLYGVHAQPRTIVLDVKGDLDPAQASNPANYKIVALGHDQRLGTADDYQVPIGSAVYDPTRGTITINPSVLFNIHYHYLLVANVPAGACGTAPLKCAQVFGRASIPACDLSARPVPVPRMTPAQFQRDQVVVRNALASWAQNQNCPPAPGPVYHPKPIVRPTPLPTPRPVPHPKPIVCPPPPPRPVCGTFIKPIIVPSWGKPVGHLKAPR